MKKLFGILAVSAFLFASCGNKADKEATDSTATEPVVAEETTPAPEAVPADTMPAEEVAPEAAPVQ